MAGPNPFVAFSGTAGYACDFLPYRKSNAYYRTLAAPRPEDWTNNSVLTSKADDSTRFVEIAASSRATWLPSVTNAANVEVLACFLMRPGVYTNPSLTPAGTNYETRIDTTAGTVAIYEGGSVVASAALPAAVWTSSLIFSDCWVRTHLQSIDRWHGVKVWSVTQAEPNTYTAIFNPTGGTSPTVLTTDPPGLGSTAVASVSACKWFSYGVASPAPTPRAASNANYFDAWLKTAHTQDAPRMLAAEIFVPGYDGSNVTNYTTAVLRAATVGYNSGNAWPYDNQVFAEALLGYPEFTRTLPEAIFGRQAFSSGDLEIGNVNGVRDDWVRAKIARGVVTLRYGDPTWPWYDLRNVFTGEAVDMTDVNGKINIKLRDSASRYDKPVARTTLVTSNANNGKPTPIAVGSVFNISPIQTDSATLTYRVGEANINSVTTVRDRGVALTTTAVGGSVSRYFAATDILRMSSAHGLLANDIVTLSSTAIAPFATATAYYVLATGLTSTDFKLSTSAGGAAVDITGNVQAIKGTLAFPDLIEFSAAHGLAINDIVQVSGAGVPGDFTVGTDYYVVSVSGLFVGLSATLGGAAINITPINQKASWTTSPAADTLQTTVAHGYAVNDPISMTGGTPPAPLVADKIYYVQSVPTAVTFTVSLTPGGAAIDITGGTAPANYCVASVFNVLKPVTGVTVNASAYRADLTAGTITLLSNPAGQITCDLQGQKFGGVYSSYASASLRILIGSGDPLVSTAIGSGVGYDNWRKACALWVTEPTNLTDLIDVLALSCYSVWGCNRIGTLVSRAMLDGFGGSPVGVITVDDMKPDGQLALTAKRLPVNYYEGIKVGYSRNYTVQKDADLAGSVSALNRTLYGSEWQVTTTNPGGSGNLAGLDLGEKGETRVIPQYDSALVSLGDANTLKNVAVINKPKQTGIFKITVVWKALDAFPVGQTVLLKIARYGWNPSVGKTAVVTGVTERMANGTCELTLLTDLDGYFPVTT